MQGAGADIREQNNREKQQLVRAHEDKLTDLYKNESNKRTELRERVTSDLQKIRESTDAEKDHTKKYFKNRMDSTKKLYDDRHQVTSRDFEKRTKDVTEAQRKETVKLNQQNQQELTKVKRGFNDQIKSLELQAVSRDTGSGEMAEFSSRQKGMKDQEIYDKKIGFLTDELSNAQNEFNARRAKDQDQFDLDLKTERAELVSGKERLKNELQADKLLTMQIVS